MIRGIKKDTATRSKGFTLVELSLSLVFVAFLSVFISIAVMRMANTYNKGITFKSINQAGRTLAADLQDSITQTNPFSVVMPADLAHVGSNTRYVNFSGGSGGRLCLGQYSYIWNYGKALNTTPLPASVNRYSSGTKMIRFIKVVDKNAYYCTNGVSATIPVASAMELLDADLYNLVIHSFSIDTQSSAKDDLTGQQLYSIEFILGTNEKSTLNASSTACKTESETGSNPLFCAINRFNIVARAASAVETK